MSPGASPERALLQNRQFEARRLKRQNRLTRVATCIGNQLSAGTGFGLPSPSSATMTKSAWVTFSIRSER